MTSEATEHHWQLTRYCADDEAETFLERLQDLAPNAPWQASVIRLEEGEPRSPSLPGQTGERVLSPLPATPSKNEAGNRLLQAGWWGAGIAGLALLCLLGWLLPRRTPPDAPGRDLIFGLIVVVTAFFGGLATSLLVQRIRRRTLSGEWRTDGAQPLEATIPPSPSQPVLLAVRIPNSLRERVAALAREIGGEVIES
ncbi:MAG: hypothetical protein ACOYNR_08900 [Blastocatellia bacterium]|jgi:hypothetical protein